jgi:hypothetical protein
MADIRMYLKQYGSRKQWKAVDHTGFIWAWDFTKKKLVEWIEYNVKCGYCEYCGEL